MDRKEFTPNDNGAVIRMLSKVSGNENKGRNRILTGAVLLCVVTLTMVFGISSGKIQAEYIQSVREAGTAASACIKRANQEQYNCVQALSYVEAAGRRIPVGSAYAQETAEEAEQDSGAQDHLVGTVCWVDEAAWEDLLCPAYTKIHGQYPHEQQEIMLPERALEALKIEAPQEGMEIRLNISVGLFRTEAEVFTLCGWFTDYADETSTASPCYISQAKLKDWGYGMEECDILLRQADHLDWRETEEKLYQDVRMREAGQKITVSNTFAYTAVNQLAGGYGMAAAGAAVVLCGMFFLIHNVLQISMMEDVRQMGLLNIIGATERQIRKIYYGQTARVLLLGLTAGAAVSALLLLAVIPEILGRQYLSGLGGPEEFRIFRPAVLSAAVLFTALLTLGASSGVIRRIVGQSCVESVHYTGLPGKRPRNSAKSSGIRQTDRPADRSADWAADPSADPFADGREAGKRRRRQRSAAAEIVYMAGRNVTRYRGRFLLTVLSLFLGMAAFLGAEVISSGSDYAHVIEQRPDFLIAGQFSEGGQAQGYGIEYRSRDAGEDPMRTDGSNIELLYDNEYDEFSPISAEVRKRLLDLDGVDQERSYIMEGAYLYSEISRKGVRPFLDETASAYARESEETELIGGWEPDTIQILSAAEIRDLEDYAEKEELPVDLESLKEGKGVILLHDHMLSPEQERMAAESIGEPVFFTSLWSQEERVSWNQMSAEERDALDKGDTEYEGERSDAFQVSGYLDNQAEGFPAIRQSWHGAEGSWHYLISEKGFARLPTEKKTLYLELNIEEGQEQAEGNLKAEIYQIISEENQRRAQITGTGISSETAEAGIFCISKSDLTAEASNYIRGNRLVLGSISAVLLVGGLMNYFNVMATGLFARRKEFEIIESIGMTKKQKYVMIVAEGGLYALLAAALMLTAGGGLLLLIRIYMEQKLSYFVFGWPAGWMLALAGGLAVICMGMPAVFLSRRGKGPERL